MKRKWQILTFGLNTCMHIRTMDMNTNTCPPPPPTSLCHLSKLFIINDLECCTEHTYAMFSTLTNIPTLTVAYVIIRNSYISKFIYLYDNGEKL